MIGAVASDVLPARRRAGRAGAVSPLMAAVVAALLGGFALAVRFPALVEGWADVALALVAVLPPVRAADRVAAFAGTGCVATDMSAFAALRRPVALATLVFAVLALDVLVFAVVVLAVVVLAVVALAVLALDVLVLGVAVFGAAVLAVTALPFAGARRLRGAAAASLASASVPVFASAFARRRLAG